ncbi:hypothetical protein V1517DRAFT_325525 [Lipomyces orientalis]|uniref:Uncharacterized protein n=1 Tax=Lipomyces orientalis TaxID=1233043 RepID=A0ACC3TKU6_9ASCO
MAGEYLKRPRQADEDETMMLLGPRPGYTPSRLTSTYSLEHKTTDAPENEQYGDVGGHVHRESAYYRTEEVSVKRLRLDDIDSDVTDESPTAGSAGGEEIGNLYDSGIDEGISYAPGLQFPPGQSPEAIDIDTSSNLDWPGSIFSNDTEYSEGTQMLDLIAPYLQRMQDDISTNTRMLVEDFRRIGRSAAAGGSDSADAWMVPLWEAGDNVRDRLEAVADDYIAFVECFVKRETRAYAELIKCYLGKHRQYSL